MAETESRNGKRPSVDWAAIERDYRVGQLTVREIARRYEIAPSSITRRAEKGGWARDFSDEIRAKTQAELLRNTKSATPERNTPSRDDIAVAVQTNVALVLSHRVDIQQTRGAVTRLIEELHDTMNNLDDIEDAIHEETERPAGDESKAEEAARFKKRQRMLAAVALPSRANIVNTLASALKTLIPLERQAFNLQDGGSDNPDEPPKQLTADMTPQQAAEAYHDKLRRIGSG